MNERNDSDQSSSEQTYKKHKNMFEDDDKEVYNKTYIDDFICKKIQNINANCLEKKNDTCNKTALDLTVPSSIDYSHKKTKSKSFNTFLGQSPDFFRRIDKFDAKNNELQVQRNLEELEANAKHDFFDLKFRRNRSLHDVTVRKKVPSKFGFQNNQCEQNRVENNSNVFVFQEQVNHPLQREFKSQHNNLFVQSFMSNDKVRSYSEADLSKPSRNNPFFTFRNGNKYNDEITQTPRHPTHESCIDPRMFYKNIATDRRINKENRAKPSFSYAQIITRALNDSRDGKLTLGEIYKWIESNFDYYKYANPVWKNSIRHNLSLSKCFKKVAREPGAKGKGGRWMIDNDFLNQEEDRKRRKSYEEENNMNHSFLNLDSEDPNF